MCLEFDGTNETRSVGTPEFTPMRASKIMHLSIDASGLADNSSSVSVLRQIIRVLRKKSPKCVETDDSLLADLMENASPGEEWKSVLDVWSSGGRQQVICRLTIGQHLYSWLYAKNLYPIVHSDKASEGTRVQIFEAKK